MSSAAIRDYPEWHLGREHYALWYVDIHSPELIAYLDVLRLHFSDFLLQPNVRQYHITLFVCGFLTKQTTTYNDDFHIDEVEQHVHALQQKPLHSFQLKLGAIDSFNTALFVHVEDAEQRLTQIKNQLGQLSQEIAPAASYCPHITLGLYQRTFNSNLLLQRIDELPTQYQNLELEIDVKQLTFGYYQAHVLQGKLMPYRQIVLGDA